MIHDDLVQPPTPEQFAANPIGEAGMIGALIALDVTNTWFSEAQWIEIAGRFAQLMVPLEDTR